MLTGQKRTVSLQASGMVKFIFGKPGLNGWDGMWETFLRSYLMEYRETGCDACDQDALSRCHLMGHRKVDH